MRCVLIGNYGAGNLGDEALKEYFMCAFPDIAWDIVSAKPGRGEFHRLPFGLRSLLTPWWKTLARVRMADAVVFGGGTLFTDAESIKAPILWFFYALMARCFRKKIFLAFQGIGPIRFSFGKALTRKVLAWSEHVSVRDAASLSLASALCLNKKIIHTFDPVLTLIDKEKKDPCSKNVLVIIPRFDSGKALNDLLSLILASHTFVEARILSLAPGSQREGRVLRAISAGILPLEAKIFPVSTMHALLHSLADAELVLSERYHGALAALVLGKEVRVPRRPGGDKIAALLEEWHLHGLEALLRRVRDGEGALRMALRGTVV